MNCQTFNGVIPDFFIFSVLYEPVVCSVVFLCHYSNSILFNIKSENCILTLFHRLILLFFMRHSETNLIVMIETISDTNNKYKLYRNPCLCMCLDYLYCSLCHPSFYVSVLTVPMLLQISNVMSLNKFTFESKHVIHCKSI